MQKTSKKFINQGDLLLLILSKEQNILLAGFIAGFGAFLGDLLIFKLIRHSFAEEVEQLSKEEIVTAISKKIPPILKNYLIPIIGGFIIASPLPDETGITLLATSTISTRTFSILSYIL